MYAFLLSLFLAGSKTQFPFFTPPRLFYMQLYSLFKPGKIFLHVIRGQLQAVSKWGDHDVVKHGFVVWRQVGQCAETLTQGLPQAAADHQKIFAFYFVMFKGMAMAG